MSGGQGGQVEAGDPGGVTDAAGPLFSAGWAGLCVWGLKTGLWKMGLGPRWGGRGSHAAPHLTGDLCSRGGDFPHPLARLS